MFYNKYIKYKYKYNQIKNKQYGGGADDGEGVGADDGEGVDVVETFSFTKYDISNINNTRGDDPTIKIIHNLQNTPNCKIGYKKLDTNIYEHYNVKSFYDLIRLPQFILKHKDDTSKANYIYIIKNFDKIISAINTRDIYETYTYIDDIYQDIIFCKCILQLYHNGLIQIINQIRDPVIVKPFTPTEYTELIQISINKYYFNMEVINNIHIKRYLKYPLYFNMCKNIAYKYGEFLEYFLFEDEKNMTLSMFNDHYEMLKNILKTNGMLLKFVPRYLKPKVVEVAVSQNGLALRFYKLSSTSTEYTNIVKIAVEQNGIALTFAQQFKNNVDICSAALEQNPLALQFVGDDIQKDKLIIRNAVTQNGISLRYVETFKNDYEIIKIAVEQNGLALEYVNKNVQDYKSLINFALKQNGMSYKFIKDPYKITDTPTIMEESVVSFINIAVSQNGMSLKFISNPTRFPNTVNFALQQNGMALQLISHANQSEEIVTHAVRQNGMSITHAAVNFKQLDHIVKIAIRQTCKCVSLIEDSTILSIIRTADIDDDTDIILNICECTIIYPIILLDNIPDTFKQNSNFIKKMMKKSPIFYLNAHQSIKDDIEVIKELLNDDINYYDYISLSQKDNQDIINHIQTMNINNNNITRGTDKIFILHIGYSQLLNIHTEIYIAYTFIQFIKTVNIDTILDSIATFISRSQTNNSKYYILISLDIYSYLRDFPAIISDFTLPYMYPNISYSYDNFIYPTRDYMINNMDIQIDTEYTEKIDSFYIKLSEYISTKSTYTTNIYIINIADKYKLSNKTHYKDIVNVLINKIMQNDNEIDNETYLDNGYKYKKLNLSRQSIYNTNLFCHWINNLFITPNILKGRVIQISGTCMTNAIFNSLILVDDIKKILIRRYLEYEKKIKSRNNSKIDYSDLRNPKITKTHFNVLYSIIGNIYNNVKHKDYYDYIIVLAAYLKNPSYNYIRDTQIPGTFNESDYFFKLCAASITNEYREKLCSDKTAYSSQLEKLNSACNYDDGNSICDTYNFDSNETYGYIYGSGGDNISVMSFLKIIFRKTILFEIPAAISTTDLLVRETIIEDTDINILLIEIDTYKVRPDTAIFNIIEERNQTRYLLQSCIMSTKTHVQCGIKNYIKTPNQQSDYFIVDSEGVETQEDWSPLLKLNKMNFPIRDKKIGNTDPHFFEADCFIYTYNKQTSSNIRENDENVENDESNSFELVII